MGKVRIKIYELGKGFPPSHEWDIEVPDESDITTIQQTVSDEAFAAGCDPADADYIIIE